LSVGLALGFAVLSSLCWAGLDATRKHLSSETSAVALVTVLSLGQLPIYVAWWASAGGRIEDPAYFGPALVEIGLNVAANLLFVRAVEISPLSVTIPFLSFTPVFATAIAIPLLGELPDPVQLAGIAAVVLGAIILASGHAVSIGLGPFAFFRALGHERGAIYMLLVALMWACTIAIDKAAMQYAALVVHAAVQNLGVGLVLITYLLLRRRVGELGVIKRHPVPMLATVVFAAGGFALQLVAIKVLLVGVVETLKRAIGLVSATVVGRVGFDEPITISKVLAALIMAGGTAALMLG
jgi:drug/metabolite transporter (DMT)-like permease